MTVRTGASVQATSQALREAAADGPDVIAVVGGDGTMRLAAEALHGTPVPLCLIPVGTGNDFAAAVGLPRDPVTAADLIFDGRDITIDLARVSRDDGSSSLYATVFASGFDSKVNERANRMRMLRGRARYNLAILIEFLRLAPIDAALTWVDADGTAGGYEGALMLMTVANTTTYGGGVPIAPSADPADGLLDLVFVRPASRWRLVRILARAFSGRHIEFDEVRVRRVREARLTSAGLTGYADGDPMGALPVTVDVLPQALVVRMPG